MGRDWSDNILIAKLRAEPQTTDELGAVATLVHNRPGCDVLVDIGAVAEPSYETLAKLTELRGLLSEQGRCCVFYNVSPAARRTFNLYGFDKVFEIADGSQIVLTPSQRQHSTGILELHTSGSTRTVERRKYVRLHIPAPLTIDVLLWHGGRKDDYHKRLPGHCWRGRLVDISEGGAQVAIDASEGALLAKGRLVGLEFRPKATEALLTFDAQVREILPTADEKNTCVGLQFVALEANPEGHYALERLCNSDSLFYEATERTTA